MEVYPSLTAAVQSHSPADTRRIYCVTQGTGNKYVIATSPATAALAVLGEQSIVLVSRNERYDAMRLALHETLEKHNATVDAKAKK